jgi:hypothetical protein
LEPAQSLGRATACALRVHIRDAPLDVKSEESVGDSLEHEREVSRVEVSPIPVAFFVGVSVLVKSA